MWSNQLPFSCLEWEKRRPCSRQQSQANGSRLSLHCSDDVRSHSVDFFFPVLVIFIFCGLIFRIGHTSVWAQVNTDITADGSLGTTVTVNGASHDISGGTRPDGGPNLFHSFGQFTVGSGDIANFRNDSGLHTSNILSRVTGGDPSQIFGTIQTTDFGNASLYLLNPAGVVFGPTASLNVGGSFHVTTADFLRLGENGIFYAELAKDGVLTMAPPEAFGFLNGNPASITVNQSRLRIPDHQTISFVGGDLSIIGNTQSGDDIAAFGGRVDLISVASTGEVQMNSEMGSVGVKLEKFSELGTIALSHDADIKSRGDGGGAVVIRGGRLLLDNSFIFSSATGSDQSPLLKDPGEGIDIQITKDVRLDHGSAIGHDVFQDLGPELGLPQIRIKSAQLELANFSEIRSEVSASGFGKKGADIVIDAETLVLRDGGFMRANTGGGSGDGGSIHIDTKNLELRDGGRIFALAFNDAAGRGGDIIIDAERVLLSNPDINGTLTAITAQTFGFATGRAGDVQITADSVNIEGGGNTFLQTQTFGPGDGGTLRLNVSGELQATGSKENPFNVGIFANTFGPGNAGNIQLSASTLLLNDHARLQSSGFQGAPGNAGNVSIEAINIELREGSSVGAAAIFGQGKGGTLNVQASEIVIDGLQDSPDPLNTDFTGFSTTTNAGDGGLMTVMADSIVVTDKGQITSLSIGAGQAGNLSLQLGKSLNVSDGGVIISSAFGTGNGGNIIIEAPEITLERVGTFFNLNNDGGTGIASQAGLFGGQAGTITLMTESLRVLEGAKISTDTFGPGRGGNISIRAEQVQVEGLDAVYQKNLQDSGGNPDFARSSIRSASNRIVHGPVGSSGNILLSVDNNVQLRKHGLISSATFTEGKGGNIDIHAANIGLESNALITAESAGIGDGGTISLDADSVTVTSGASITAESTFSGNAGAVTVSAQEIDLTGVGQSLDPFGQDFTGISTRTIMGTGGNLKIQGDTVSISDKALLTSATAGEGQAGDVQIQLNDVLRLTEGGAISASTSGAGNGGNIAIAAASVVVEGVGQFNGPADEGRSAITSQTLLGGGNAGNIRVSAPTVEISDGGAISADTFGAGLGGNIEVTGDTVTVSGINEGLKDALAKIPGVSAKTLDQSPRSGISATASGALLGDAATGKAGNIQIAGSTVLIQDGGLVSSETTSGGAGGTVTVTGTQVTLENDAVVSAQSSVFPSAGSAGDVAIAAEETFKASHSLVASSAEEAAGGNVTITAGNDIELRQGTVVSAQTTGLNDAGDILLEAGDALMLDGSQVNTLAEQADGGNMKFTASEIVQLTDSQITSSVGGGADTVGGNISIDPDYIVLQNSQILANAFEGQGGNISLVATKAVLADPLSVLDASSALGISGSVNIQAPIQNLSGTIAPLPQTPVSVASLYASRCAARDGGQYSSFSSTDRGGLPVTPGGLLSSPMNLLSSLKNELSSKNPSASLPMMDNVSTKTSYRKGNRPWLSDTCG